MPIRRWFSISVGMMGMSPDDFWNISPVELYAALDGFTEFNSDSSQSDPLGRDQLEELMELYPD